MAAVVFTMAVRCGPVWTRRAVLVTAGGAGVAAVLSGCTLFAREQPDDPPPDPLEPLLAATRALAARYQEDIAAHPELAPRLEPIRQAHEAHAEALRELIGPSPTPSAGSGTWAPPLATPTRGAEDPADVLAILADAERAGAREARLACLSAPPERAGLLGSITAARATHAEVLTWPD